MKGFIGIDQVEIALYLGVCGCLCVCGLYKYKLNIKYRISYT
uniref:Uncharacterized protein n=1 Tax=Anguilla anguilla TaxID=7936 RepID=A0A0E9WID2_ANGAN